MKKVLRISLGIIGILVLVVMGLAGFVAVRGIPTYEKPDIPDLKVDATPARIARGESIAQFQCIACHMGKDGRLSGKHLDDAPEVFGKLYSKNITRDPVAGIGNWTDGELYYFLRTGVRKDGTPGVIMPKFPIMADEDIISVIAWMRSEAEVLKPTRNEAPQTEYNFFVKALANTVMTPLDPPTQPILIPDSTDQIAYGKYVADALATCYGCHSADFTDQDPLKPENSKGYYGGGIAMKDQNGKTVYTANLTFDETGIGGRYTEEAFVKAVKYGVKADGTPTRYPMFPHTSLKDSEVKAIYAYLKTVPKQKTVKQPEEQPVAAR